MPRKSRATNSQNNFNQVRVINFIKFEFIRNLQAKFKFFIFNFASSSSESFIELAISSSSLYQV